MNLEGQTPQEEAVSWLERIHGELEEIKKELKSQFTPFWSDAIQKAFDAVLQGVVIAVFMAIVLKSK